MADHATDSAAKDNDNGEQSRAEELPQCWNSDFVGFFMEEDVFF